MASSCISCSVRSPRLRQLRCTPLMLPVCSTPTVALALASPLGGLGNHFSDVLIYSQTRRPTPSGRPRPLLRNAILILRDRGASLPLACPIPIHPRARSTTKTCPRSSAHDAPKMVCPNRRPSPGTCRAPSSESPLWLSRPRPRQHRPHLRRIRHRLHYGTLEMGGQLPWQELAPSSHSLS